MAYLNADEGKRTFALRTDRRAAQPSGSDRRRWFALALLCVAMFVVILDASIINVAPPTVGRSLKVSQTDLPWVVNAYILTFGGFLLIGGRVADLVGRRRVFSACLGAWQSGGVARCADPGVSGRVPRRRSDRDPALARHAGVDPRP